MHVTDKPAVFSCFGLGSCIGLFLYDRLRKIGGAAHILLPNSKNGSDLEPASYADTAIELLIARIQKLGGNPDALRAIVIGGANVIDNCSFQVGAQNCEAVQKQLIGNKIYIHKKEIGGYLSRSVQFFTQDGSYKIIKTITKKSNYNV